MGSSAGQQHGAVGWRSASGSLRAGRSPQGLRRGPPLFYHFPGAGGERERAAVRNKGNGEMLRVVGVIDLMGGLAVHAVGGRRAEYRPVASPLCESAAPLAVAEAFRREYGIEELYLADLEAIAA